MSAGYKPPALPYLERPVTVDELACVYSALILADDDIPVTPDKINTLVKAANIEVESIWPSLFARALAGANLKEMIQNSVLAGGGGGPGVAAAAAGGPAAAAAPAEEESKPPAEPEEDSDDDDFGLGLFD